MQSCHPKFNSKYKKIFIEFLILILTLSIFPSVSANPTEDSNLEPLEILTFGANTIDAYHIYLDWEITGNYEFSKIFRKFIDTYTEVAELANAEQNFIDIVDFGTMYSYQIIFYDVEGKELASSELVEITTNVDSLFDGAPQFAWQDYKLQKYPHFADDYLDYNDIDYEIHKYRMHGVSVIVAIENGVSTLERRKLYSNNIFRYFHRHWYKFRLFPLDEYRIIIETDGRIISEDELGVLYSPAEIDLQ